MLLEAEQEGAVAVLPEAVLEPQASPGAPHLVGSLADLWDLDYYVLMLHCLTGIVSVRPGDVGLAVSTGVAVGEARFESEGLKKLVGAQRMITRRTRPDGDGERMLRNALASKLVEVATKPASTGAAAAGGGSVGGASNDLTAMLTELAGSTRSEPQLAAAMLRNLSSLMLASSGAGGGAVSSSGVGGMGTPPLDGTRAAQEMFDALWRAHRRALLPSDAVLARASAALLKLREAATAADATERGGSRPPYLLGVRMLHDKASIPAASAAASKLLSAEASAKSRSSSVKLPSPTDDIEVDSSGDSASPMRVVETVQRCAMAHRTPSRITLTACFGIATQRVHTRALLRSLT